MHRYAALTPEQPSSVADKQTGLRLTVREGIRAVGRQHMEMNIQFQGRSKSLYKGHDAGLSSGPTGQASYAPSGANITRNIARFFPIRPLNQYHTHNANRR